MSLLTSHVYLSEGETTRPSEDLATVCDITELASRTRDRDELFTFALDRLLGLTGMEMGAVLLLDRSRCLELCVQRGLPGALLRHLQDGVALERSVPAYTMRECRLIVLHDAARDPRELPAWRQLGLQTHVCIPLHVGRRALGVLCLLSFDEQRFSPQRQEMLSAAGGVIGLALERLRSYERVRAEAAEAKEALETRKLVERAKGILMQRVGLSEADAFRRLQRLSSDRCQSLKQTAMEVLAADQVFSSDHSQGREPSAPRRGSQGVDGREPAV